VELDDYLANGKSLTVCIRPRNGARYRTLFIGSGGQVLQETPGTTATYAVRGNEQYVRAKVIDSNGRAAWLQPVFVRRQE
jgi:hypothetical protein